MGGKGGPWQMKKASSSTEVGGGGGGGGPLVGCRENPILILMRVSLPSTLR